MRTGPKGFALVLGVMLAMVGSCKSDTNANIDPDAIDPAATASYLRRNFSHIPRLTDGLTRVLATLAGNPQPGVSFTPITGGVQGTVAVDLDGDGSMETSVNARVILNNPPAGLAGGGVLTVTAINAASTTGSASANIAMQGSSTVVFSSGQATLFPTNGPSEIIVSDANLTVTPSLTNPVLTGAADFATASTDGTAFFESNGSGGFRIRITSPDFATITVP